MSFKTSVATSPSRVIDKQLTLYDIITRPDFQFDLVKATLKGNHPPVVNRISDRAYFILSGIGTVMVDQASYEVQTHDVVRIPRGTRHSIMGALEYLIITAPPFDPENEEVFE